VVRNEEHEGEETDVVLRLILYKDSSPKTVILLMFSLDLDGQKNKKGYFQLHHHGITTLPVTATFQEPLREVQYIEFSLD
jgi:hypothetical protein